MSEVPQISQVDHFGPVNDIRFQPLYELLNPANSPYHPLAIEEQVARLNSIISPNDRDGLAGFYTYAQEYARHAYWSDAASPKRMVTQRVMEDFWAGSTRYAFSLIFGENPSTQEARRVLETLRGFAQKFSLPIRLTRTNNNIGLLSRYEALTSDNRQTAMRVLLDQIQVFSRLIQQEEALRKPLQESSPTNPILGYHLLSEAEYRNNYAVLLTDLVVLHVLPMPNHIADQKAVILLERARDYLQEAIRLTDGPTKLSQDVTAQRLMQRSNLAYVYILQVERDITRRQALDIETIRGAIRNITQAHSIMSNLPTLRTRYNAEVNRRLADCCMTLHEAQRYQPIILSQLIATDKEPLKRLLSIPDIPPQTVQLDQTTLLARAGDYLQLAQSPDADDEDKVYLARSEAHYRELKDALPPSDVIVFQNDHK